MAAETAEPSDLPDDRSSHDDDFARLFARHHRMLFGYLMTALGSPADAEEAFQETCMILWKEHAQFVPGTSFVNWSLTIAQNQVRRVRRDRQRLLLLPSEQLLDQIAVECSAPVEVQEQRRSALGHCLERLTDRDRKLVATAYGTDGTLKDAAEQLNWPVNTVYKALNRIRRRLLECIERTLAAEGRS